MKPYVTLCMQTHFFQHRLCWQLSSLIGQPVTVNVAHMPGNGTPTTEECIDLFRSAGLDVRSCVFEDYERFQFRGNTRNAQLQEIDTPWVLWTDTDMVWNPRFFRRLGRHITPGYDRIYGNGRMSQDNKIKAVTDKLVATCDYPCVVSNAFAQAHTLPLKRWGGVAPGHFQLCWTELCGSYYIDARRNKDQGWTDTFSKCNSDYQFRHRIGKWKTLPRWYARNVVHINHKRGSEVGHHIEDQR